MNAKENPHPTPVQERYRMQHDKYMAMMEAKDREMARQNLEEMMALEMFSKPSTFRSSASTDGISTGKFRNADAEEMVETECKHRVNKTLLSEDSDSSCRAGMMVGIARSLFPSPESSGLEEGGEN